MKKDPNVHYIHYLSQGVREQLVGSFFIIALLIVAALMVAKIYSTKVFDEVVSYHAYMKNAQGVSTQTPINISGIEVGKVSGIEISNDNKIHIQFFIYKSFERLIRTDSTGELSKLSIVGSVVIFINAGNPTLPLLPTGSTIVVKEPINLNDLGSTISNLTDMISVVKPESIQKSIDSLVAIMKNIEKITHHVASGQGSLGKVIYDKQQAQLVSATLGAFATSLKEIEQRINQSQPLIENLTLLSAESQEMILDVRRSLKKIDRALVHLPFMVDDTQMLIRSTKQTMQGLQQLWPLSNTIPPPNKELLLIEGTLHD